MTPCIRQQSKAGADKRRWRDGWRTRALEATEPSVLRVRPARPVATDIFDVQRFRNVYVVNLDRLSESAEVPERPKGTPVAVEAPKRKVKIVRNKA